MQDYNKPSLTFGAILCHKTRYSDTKFEPILIESFRNIYLIYTYIKPIIFLQSQKPAGALASLALWPMSCGTDTIRNQLSLSQSAVIRATVEGHYLLLK